MAGPNNLDISKQRLMGYRKALEDAGIPFDESLIIQDDKATDEVVSKNLILDFLQTADTLPDGIFASNDICALGSIKAIKEFGLKVPKDIGVVGFSNWQFTSMTEPTISTISQPGFEMGQEAARLLIRDIESEEDVALEPVYKTFKTELIVRGSSVRHH